MPAEADDAAKQAPRFAAVLQSSGGVRGFVPHFILLLWAELICTLHRYLPSQCCSCHIGRQLPVLCVRRGRELLRGQPNPVSLIKCLLLFTCIQTTRIPRPIDSLEAPGFEFGFCFETVSLEIASERTLQGHVAP